MAACSEHSPAQPGASPSAITSHQDAHGQATAPGTYDISFLKETHQGLQSIDSTLNVGEFLVLKAEVRDSSGALAQRGTVTYEYCSLGNVKVQSSNCDTGSGRWKRLWSVSVDSVGSLFGFGACSTPRTIGFRFRYAGQNSGIADGVSASKDVSWVAQ